MTLNDIFQVFDNGSLRNLSDGELRYMHKFCVNSQPGDLFTRTKNERVVIAIEGLLASREAAERNKDLISEQQRLHGVHVAELQNLRGSVETLKKPHWTMTPNFWIALLAMVFAAIAAWPVIRGWLPTDQPIRKVASPSPPQSNSVPVKIPTPSISIPASYAVPTTNHGIVPKPSVP